VEGCDHDLIKHWGIPQRSQLMWSMVCPSFYPGISRSQIARLTARVNLLFYRFIWIPKWVFFLFISVLNQLDVQNLFHNKIYFMPLHVSSTCAHHQVVKIALHNLWYHHTYRCDEHKCSKHVEAWNKTYCETILCIKLVKYWDKYTEMHGQQNVKKWVSFFCFSKEIHRVLYIELTKLNSVALVRTRTIPTERPPPVGEVSANFCG